MWSAFRKFQRLFSTRQKRQRVGLFFLMLFGAFLEILGVSLIVPLVSVVMQGDFLKSIQFVVVVCIFLHIDSDRVFFI